MLQVKKMADYSVYAIIWLNQPQKSRYEIIDIKMWMCEQTAVGGGATNIDEGILVTVPVRTLLNTILLFHCKDNFFRIIKWV